MVDTHQQRLDYLKRLDGLRQERSTWIAHWQELGTYIRPRAFRYLLAEVNKGLKKNDKIINSTGTHALRTMAAGMMAGITSPARPWFRLTTRDPDLGEFGPVRSWLDVAEDRLRKAFAGSNIYRGLHKVYESLGQFGTAAMHVEDDFKDTLRGYEFPIGQYMLANSDRLQVDSVYREFIMTAGQLARRFGADKCSEFVQTALREKRPDTRSNVLHIIEPNDEYQPGKLGPKGKAWRSVWMEAGKESIQGFLRDSAYEEFPVMAPRWNTTGEDVYGESPGMDALGDIKALQHLERSKGQVGDKIHSPPMRAPASLRNQFSSLMPGSVTFVPENMGGQKYEPAVEVHPQAMTVLEASIREHEARINRAFFADLWLMMAQSDDPQMTAREVAERHEEKMLQLGPVMEGLERELLGPLIDRAFSILLRKPGALPRPPPELHGQSLSVEYLSIMTAAQKMLGITAKDKLSAFIISVATVNPEVVDKVNYDALVEDYADDLGVKSNLIRPQEEVDALRQKRQAQQAQQAQAEQATNLAGAAKTLSDTDLGGNTALTKLMAGFPGAAQPGDAQ